MSYLDNLDLDAQVRHMMRRALNGHIDWFMLQRWLVRNSERIYAEHPSPGSRLAYEVEALFAEYGNGDFSEDDLRRFFWELLPEGPPTDPPPFLWRE